MMSPGNSVRTGRAASVVVALSMLAMVGSARAQNAAGVAAGQSLYPAKCGGCHSLDANRIGPAHCGVVGRKPGSAPGYAYSTAVKKLGGVWTPATLDRWLQNPQAVAPGAKMYLMVGDAVQRRQIIAYLAANSPPRRS